MSLVTILCGIIIGYFFIPGAMGIAEWARSGCRENVFGGAFGVVAVVSFAYAITMVSEEVAVAAVLAAIFTFTAAVATKWNEPLLEEVRSRH